MIERAHEEKEEPARASDDTNDAHESAVVKVTRIEGLRNSSEDPSDDCRYYCPLCMLYYECVFEAKCCGHTICDECAVDFYKTANKGVATPGTFDDGAEASIPLTPRLTSSETLSVECPHCRHEVLEMKLITPGEAGDHLRNYEDSPAVATRTPGRGSLSRGLARPSPLKVGDSFEKMKAKLVPFESNSAGKPPLPPRMTTPVHRDKEVEVIPHAVNATPSQEQGEAVYSTPHPERGEAGNVLVDSPREDDAAQASSQRENAEQPGTPCADANAQPDTPAAQPGTPAAQPDTSAAQPGTPAAQPGTPAAQPDTPAAQPGTPKAQPSTPAVPITPGEHPDTPSPTTQLTERPVTPAQPGNSGDVLAGQPATPGERDVGVYQPRVSQAALMVAETPNHTLTANIDGIEQPEIIQAAA